MAVKIRLKRMGKIRAPYYRIVVADSRAKRDGRAIEEIGKYHPTQEPSLIEVNSQRAQHWLSVGAQPTEPVTALLKITGDWQRFTGEPGAEGTLRTAEAKPDKKAIFEVAAKEGFDAPAEGATTDRKKATMPKAEAKKDDTRKGQRKPAPETEVVAAPTEDTAATSAAAGTEPVGHDEPTTVETSQADG